MTIHRPGYWETACTALMKGDPVMAELIQRYHGETLSSKGSPFLSLARAVVGQQISVAAAASVWGKLEKALDGHITPSAVIAADETTLRGAGLSGQKVKYLKHLSEFCIKTPMTFEGLQMHTDEEVIELLTQIKGIGRWTAEMFLIFYLLRPDVFPVADLGIQKAIQRHYDSDQYQDIAAQWQPWRTVASWYLWRSLDPIPVEY